MTTIDALPRSVRDHLSPTGPEDLSVFTPDATVIDDGHTHTGHAAIQAWLDTTAAEFTYTATPLSAVEHDPTHVTVVQRVEGDFPGGRVDLRYDFTLRDGLIEHLVIAP